MSANEVEQVVVVIKKYKFAICHQNNNYINVCKNNKNNNNM